jgi:FixJ family two-component response regulator
MTEGNAMVCVVEDDASMRDALQRLLRSVGLQVETFASAREFLQRQGAEVPGCLVLDVRLPGLSGLDLQRELVEARIHTPIIFITGHGDIPMTVRAMKAGILLRETCDGGRAQGHSQRWHSRCHAFPHRVGAYYPADDR